MSEPLSPAAIMRKLPLGLLLGWALIAGTAQAQVMRCVDAKTGEVTYTNGRCISGEMSTQIQAAQSAEEIATERANASQARERSKAQMARDDAQRRQREEQERKEREAAERAQARAGVNLENTPACRQARERYNAILAEASPDPATWGERSQAAQAQMEMSCLGAAAYQQLQQSRALQPNAINRPQWGYGYPPNRYPPARPTPSQPPAKIVNCNVFRCYDNRGGVHPIP
ncbi:DUF4124 domain-containing protein [Comamonas sp. C11]|uniref:DUF4124 domain-containing protein n=1 Tax=Comamonas sp. C11 TaxID=2966554 RepID=UPI002112597E|nr:DUF4124 domain-containing protein [Comamonas sp. C11]UUC92582.1 DUF4124 domain-containing protein [Comamonas sp. C11]